MSTADDAYSPILRCLRCLHKARMKIVGQYSQVQSHFSQNPHFEWNAGPVHQMLLCPACDGVSFARFDYHDHLDTSETEILYPTTQKTPEGLPQNIAKEYEAALKVRDVSANAFGVLMRRLLELVCADRRAEGRSLHDQLSSLVERGEIPRQLGDMAHSLRAFGNIGAHASAGELTSDEIPFLDKLCEAILEYVYYAPHLLQEADEHLERMKKAGPE